MDNFILVEFFKTNRSVITTHLYILHLLSGAAYYEKCVRFKFRCFLTVYLIVAYLGCTIPQFRILIQQPALEYTFHNFALLSFVHFVIAIIFTFYRKKKEFHRLIEMIGKNSARLVVEIDDENTENYLEEYKILKIHHKFYFLLIFTFGFAFLEKIAARLLSQDDEKPYNVKSDSEFFIPFFCDNCDTQISYYLAIGSSYILISCFGIIHLASLCLIVVFSMHLKNQAIVLNNTIRYHSEFTRKKLENLCVDEEQELNKSQPNDFKLRTMAKQREKHVKEFMLKVNQWIKIHQHFVAFTKQYQTCGKGLFEMQVLLSSFNIIILGYFGTRLLVDREEIPNEFFLYLMIQLIMLLVCCGLGTAFDSVNGIISEAVYATPWYYLPVKDQKVILNFLTLSQREQEIRLFGIFELNLELFPVILNKAYEYIGIMRLFVLRENMM